MALIGGIAAGCTGACVAGAACWDGCAGAVAI
jgi:hypothetical protein